LKALNRHTRAVSGRGTQRAWCGVVLLVCLAAMLLPAAASARSTAGHSPEIEELFTGAPYDKDAPQGIFERSCSFIHSSGNLLLHMTNAGFVGDYFGRFCSRPSCEWPPGSNNEYLFMGGLWVGAIDADGNPHFAYYDWGLGVLKYATLK